MRRALALLVAAAAAAYAQGVPPEERARRAVVRVEAVDLAVRRAQALLASNAGEDELRRVRIRQPFTLVTAGFAISPEGEIVTPALHPEAPLEVTVVFWDEARAPASIVGTDPRSHLALLRVARRTEDYLELAGGAPALGQRVRIVGDGLDRTASATASVVRTQVALSIPDLYGVFDGRPVPMGSVFAIDGGACRAAPGSPCLDAEGRVLGMIFAALPARPSMEEDGGGATVVRVVQTNFAIPAARIARIVADLRDDGRVLRGRFGLCVEPVSEAMRAQFDLPPCAGAVVGVEPGGPAARAGVRPHDVLLDLEGRTFADLHQLAEALSDCAPGVEARLRILRAGAPWDVRVTPE
jgi:serine protease Do